MKKILARLAQGDNDELGNSHGNISGAINTSHFASFIGRHFHFGKLTLVVDEIIAEGGFGVVFRVRSQHGQYFALKRTCVNSDQKLAVCKREITIVSSLSHKNILRSIDSRINSLSDGIFEVLLLTAYYPGSLSQLLAERQQHQQRLTEVEVLRIFCDLCEAVCRLHHCKTPIMHRDLKIENILIDERQNFVLCDFGSATSRVLHPMVHGLERCQEEINRYTTLAYRAPEMINLYSGVPLGPQIDIWAMGCLLYFLCFTVLPFGDSSLAIQSGVYSIPDASPYSEKLHRLIGYLLQVDATKRPDIYQVSALAFSLAGRPNPAQNLNNLTVPHWKNLTLPPRESQLKAARTQLAIESTTERSAVSPTREKTEAVVSVTNTSVVPRQRPRPGPIGHSPLTTDSPLVSLKPPPNSSVSLRHSSSHTAETSADPPFQSDSDTGQFACHSPIPEQEETEQWEADFANEALDSKSNCLTSTTTPLSSSNLFHRGHHRTWSLDVTCVSNGSSGLQTSVSSVVPKVIRQTSENFYQPVSVPVNDANQSPKAEQLRQTRSLLSLPTSTRFPVPCATSNGHRTVRPPLPPSNTGNSQNSGIFRAPFTWSHGPSVRLGPLGNEFYLSDPDVNDDELFGAAFDAIRNKSERQQL